MVAGHFDLSGKRALITGGTAGIGRGVAQRFVEAGAQVVISGTRDDGGDVAAEVGAAFARSDLTEPGATKELVLHAADRLGGLDIAVVNAGVAWPTGEVTDTDMSDYDSIMAVNARAAFELLKHAPAAMADGGSIITTASVSGMEGGGGSAVYAASKAALLNLTQSSALELAGRGIRVNAVSPGPIATGMWGDVDPNQFGRWGLPLGRAGLVEECVGVYHFLAADESRFVTGINLVVDGGYMAGTAPQLYELVARQS